MVYEIGKQYTDVNGHVFTREAISNEEETNLYIYKEPITEEGVKYKLSKEVEKIGGDIAVDGYITLGRIPIYNCMINTVRHQLLDLDFYVRFAELNKLPKPTLDTEMITIGLATSYNQYKSKIYGAYPRSGLDFVDTLDGENITYHIPDGDMIYITIPLELVENKKEGDHIRFKYESILRVINENKTIFHLPGIINFDIRLSQLRIYNGENCKFPFEVMLNNLMGMYCGK